MQSRNISRKQLRIKILRTVMQITICEIAQANKSFLSRNSRSDNADHPTQTRQKSAGRREWCVSKSCMMIQITMFQHSKTAQANESIVSQNRVWWCRLQCCNAVRQYDLKKVSCLEIMYFYHADHNIPTKLDSTSRRKDCVSKSFMITQIITWYLSKSRTGTSSSLATGKRAERKVTRASLVCR